MASATFVQATRNTPSAQRYYDRSFHAALRRHGVDVTVLAPTTHMLPAGVTREGYAGSRSLPPRPRFVLDLARAPGRVVVCREYGLETLVSLLVAAAQRRPRVVFQEHVGRAGYPLSRLDLLYRRGIARLTTAFVANTAAARAEIEHTLRVEPRRVVELMMLVPPHRFELCVDELELPEPSERPLFLFVGQLVPRKNVAALVEASARLHAEGTPFAVWIAGDGPERAPLERLVAERGLGSAVRFLGPVGYGAIGHLYEACDVFVMPTRADYRSVSVLEAMRFGKPVLDSACDGNAGDSVRDGWNGAVFEPGDPEQLARCMRRLAHEPELALRWGARSAVAMAMHTPDAAAIAFADLLRRVERERPERRRAAPGTRSARSRAPLRLRSPTQRR